VSASHPEAIRNAWAELINERLGSGKLEFQSSSGAEVATLTFTDPAAPSPSGGELTFTLLVADEDSTGGTIAKAVAKDSEGNEVFTENSVTKTGGGGRIELDELTVAPGRKVSLSSLTYTAPL
jgi:hypothetical protein